MSCATGDCTDPNCPTCTAPERTAHVVGADDFDERARHLLADAELPSLDQLMRECVALDLKPHAPALNGMKPRPSRDPRFIKRRRKAIGKL